MLYRSPAFKHNSPEFQTFLSDFGNLHSKIQAENRFAMFFTGYFNGHSQLWWNDGDTNLEGQGNGRTIQFDKPISNYF